MQLFSMRRAPKHQFRERKSPRVATFGVVEIHNCRGSVLERATLRDLSVNGVLMQLASSQHLPDRITLWFPTDRIEMAATVRWRKGRSIGVEFDGPIVLPERMEYRKDRAAVIASYFKTANG